MGGATQDTSSELNETKFNKVYAFLKSQRPAPKQEYKFSRRDDIKTTTGVMPPSPCCQCGSPNHWNKECPHYVQYDKAQEMKKLGHYVAEDSDYVKTYVHAVNKWAFDTYELASEQFAMDLGPTPDPLSFQYSQWEV
jgi:hypothetical protein